MSGGGGLEVILGDNGEIILAGSFTRPMWVSRGDSVLCDYGPMGTITCRFT